MEFLRSIIPLIDNVQFEKGLLEGSQLKQLYELVRSQKVISDAEAQQILYGNTNTNLAYKKLKQRLKERLTSQIVQYGVTLKNLDDYSRLYRKCMSQVMAVKTLMLSHARTAAVDIGENLIKTTIGYEYTDLTLYLARELFNYYGAINYNPTKKRKYLELLDESQQLYERELEVTRYYCELNSAFSVSRASHKGKTLSNAINYSNIVLPYLKHPGISYQLLLMIYQILTMRYELEQDYENLLDICDKATNAFKNRKVSRKFAFYQFDIYKIICNIQFGKIHEAEKIAETYFQQMTPGLLNWFVLKLYIMVGRLHAKNYQGAYDIVSEIRRDLGRAKIPAPLMQTWIVYEAQIEFLVSINKIKTNLPSRFRLYKFLNEIPIYTKDKKGLNISILIVHTLMLLQQRKFNQIIDRVDALNQYCHRHLRRDDTFRPNCFIKMLLQIPKADFNRKRTERYAENYLKKLKSMPIMISDQTIEVEIIPYEDLWEMALGLLD